MSTIPGATDIIVAAIESAWGIDRAAPAEREVTAGRLGSVLKELRGLEVLALDAAARTKLPPIHSMNLGDILSEVGAAGWPIAALFAAHRDGYVREQCVQRLAESGVAAVTPFLILRMNDWVEPVRKIAQAAMRSRLAGSSASTFFRDARLLNRVRSWGRADHRPFLADLDSLLAGPEAAPAREAALRDSDAFTRRYAFALSLRSPQAQPLELVTYAVGSKDKLLRKDAIKYLNRLAPEQRAELAREFLLDVDAVIRQWAQRAVRSLADFDCAEFYRSRIAADNDTRTALYGLGETGKVDDAELVASCLRHPSTAVRRASLYALAWLDAEGSADRFVEALGSDRARVARDAATWLIRSSHMIGSREEAIRQLLSSQHAATQLCARQVLEAGAEYSSRWAEDGS